MVYGIFVGWSVHGRLTCPICHSNIDCFHLTAGGKISYFDYHRCWLPPKHPFRMQEDSFRKDTIVKKGYGTEHNWTYHIERALKYLKAMVGNKARVEISIAESFLLKGKIYF
jgi:hypothetical protein